VILVQTKGVPAVLLIMFGGEYSSQDKEMAKELVLTVEYLRCKTQKNTDMLAVIKITGNSECSRKCLI
jgi:hypothetical protein